MTEIINAGSPKKIPTENPEPGRCSFYLSGRKARFCRSLSVPGQRFCGNHLHLAGGSDATSATCLAAAQRVACPLDPSHTVLASELAVHVAKRCPALQLALHERAKPHFMQDVNAGSDTEPELPPPPPPPPPRAGPSCPKGGGGGGDGCGVCTAGPFARGRAAQRAALARSLGVAEFEALIARFEAAHAAVCGLDPPPACVLRPPPCEQLLAPSQERRDRPTDRKHGLQHASIVGNMQRAGLISPGSQGCTGMAVVELGAGKGYLGASLVECCGLSRLVAVDVAAGLTKKADRHLRNIVFGRHRIDVKDYVPTATPELTSAPYGTPWVAVAKHLCGAATDYGLRACLLPYDVISTAKDGAVVLTEPGAAAAAAPVVTEGPPALGPEGSSGLGKGAEQKRRRMGQEGPALTGGQEGPALTGGQEGGEDAGGPPPRLQQLPPQQQQQQPPLGNPSAEPDGDQRPGRSGAGSEGGPGGSSGGCDGGDVTQGGEGKEGGGALEGGGCGADGNKSGDEGSGCGGGDGGGGGSSRCGGSAVFRGLAIAPCCHHRCGWRAYVGKEMFWRLGLSARDFELISWMTGWALCGHDSPAGQPVGTATDGEGEYEAECELQQQKQEEDHHRQKQLFQHQHQQPPSFDPAAHLPRPCRMALGLKCKQLIDAGRLQWLQQRFDTAELVSYIEPEVSGENRLLLAVGPRGRLSGGGKFSREYIKTGC